MSPGGTFIVRFWQETRHARDQQWRGVVIHVHSGERVPVRSVEEATDVILTYLRDPASSLPHDEITPSHRPDPMPWKEENEHA
ncbi:MAG: DUF3104 domain-containing protein [Chloroflexi bacterium]|nr:DUF3104 domain-containing protein [Chloroflexota bacterium]